MKTLAINALEKTFNRYLSLDPDSASLLAPLEGRVMGLHLQRPKIAVFFSFTATSVQLSTERPETVNTEIFTTLFQLMRLKWNKSSSLVNSQFHIQGDVETAQLFNQLFEKHHIDWEEKLSSLIGDVAAHKMTQLLKKPVEFARRNKTKLGQDCTEYLQEEARWLPSQNEVTAFLQETDELRLNIDRLQAKIELLQQKIPSHPPFEKGRT